MVTYTQKCSTKLQPVGTLTGYSLRILLSEFSTDSFMLRADFWRFAVEEDHSLGLGLSFHHGHWLVLVLGWLKIGKAVKFPQPSSRHPLFPSISLHLCHMCFKSFCSLPILLQSEQLSCNSHSFLCTLWADSNIGSFAIWNTTCIGKAQGKLWQVSSNLERTFYTLQPGGKIMVFKS